MGSAVIPSLGNDFATSAYQRFNVPQGVSIITVTMLGGGSGTSRGGRVKGKIKVKDTDQLRIMVGTQGRSTSGARGGAGGTGGGGRGGNGGAPGRPGGDGGGGATVIRLNNNGGTVLAVAGGAGGASGDGAKGGAGGGGTGEDGYRTNGGRGNVATGGSATRGGNGGKIGSNANFNGGNASDDIIGEGGAGGFAENDKSQGGGGGGGGYHAGGGGQAGKGGTGGWDGGGGAGGSSFTGQMYEVEINDRQGTTGDGSVLLEWQDFGDYPPVTPTDVRINGEDESSEMPIRRLRANITATVQDPTVKQQVRLVAIVSTIGDPEGVLEFGRVIAYSRHVGNWVYTDQRSEVSLVGLPSNTKYYVRLFAEDTRGQLSGTSNGVTFWTARSPETPERSGPQDRTEFNSSNNIQFAWTFDHPDRDGNNPMPQTAFALRVRQAATVSASLGDWSQIDQETNTQSVTIPANTYRPGFWYEWQVAVRDENGLWSPWSTSGTFKVNAIALPPYLVGPGYDNALYAADPITFSWQFRTLLADERQVRADLRYRPVGGNEETWEVIAGDAITPGSGASWTLPPNTFNEQQNYEWQVRTHTTNGTTSEWSSSMTFWSATAPGGAVDPIPIDFTRVAESLGSYDNRVYIYKRGGQVLMGELSPIKDVQWSRKRDDIGGATIHMDQWGKETLEFLRTLRPWAHEVVIFRNGVRAFEGPITRITGTGSRGVEIEAKDVLGYVYRRILRQGYNDSYQVNAGVQVGLKTVVERATSIILNALVYDDPNVLPYLSPMHNYGDPIQSRSVKPYTKTAWEEVDDLAAHAGLDYSVIGRRIILNDTHRPVGRLPEMREGHFSELPIVTLYGMTYATDSATTNNNGIWGMATRRGDDFNETGHIEMLNSQYGETDVAGAGTDTLTPEEQAALVNLLASQSERNIAGRYPMPAVVRVPDNATLSPDVNLTINQLVPGVWIPVRATGGVIEASQWQKLDSVTVRQDDKGEKIAVVMSPAPNGGADPDADIDSEG